MNHPSREEWMSFLYDELDNSQREACVAHLAICPQCKRQVDQWQATRSDLSAYVVPPRVAAVRAPRFAWRWAAAAAVLLLASGFAVGRIASPTVDTATLKAELRNEIATQFQADTRRAANDTLANIREETATHMADLARYYEQKRLEDQQSFYRTATELENKLAADYASLRKDLETVAVLTEAGFRQTERQLVSFADNRTPQTLPSTNP
jgi:hypothetical protein